MSAEEQWNSFARVNASQRWRRQSAAMGRAMTEAIVAEAQVGEGMWAIDVASGTGEPAISIASLLKGSGKVVATDISAEPLKIAGQRARERGLVNLECVLADVHHLPFPDMQFDRATSRLGVMFFANLPQALREIRRVLKPGGRASLLAWGAMDQPYFHCTVGTVLRLLPELTLPASCMALFKFGASGTLSQALMEAGFAKAEERVAEVPWNWPGTPAELWEWFQAVTVPFHPLLQAIPAERRQEVDAEVIAALDRRYEGGEVRFQASMVLASAIR